MGKRDDTVFAECRASLLRWSVNPVDRSCPLDSLDEAASSTNADV